MMSDDLKAAMERATLYNRELDDRLSRTGVVDGELFREFAAVQQDPNASSVGWLQAKLRLLAERVSSGAALSLYEPSGTTVVAVTTRTLFEWADQHFPIARVRS